MHYLLTFPVGSRRMSVFTNAEQEQYVHKLYRRALGLGAATITAALLVPLGAGVAVAQPGAGVVGPTLLEQSAGINPRVSPPDSVNCVQQAVGIPVDGLYGQSTFDAVQAFQAENQLTVDGVVGPATGDAIMKKLEGTDSYTSCYYYLPTTWAMPSDTEPAPPAIDCRENDLRVPDAISDAGLASTVEEVTTTNPDFEGLKVALRNSTADPGCVWALMQTPDLVGKNPLTDYMLVAQTFVWIEKEGQEDKLGFRGAVESYATSAADSTWTGSLPVGPEDRVRACTGATTWVGDVSKTRGNIATDPNSDNATCTQWWSPSA